MSQKTEQLNAAIQEFLESINREDLQAVKISFEEKPEIEARRVCRWVFDEAANDLVWKCFG